MDQFTDNPTAWLDRLAMVGYLGFAVFIAWQVMGRSR